MQLIKTLLNRTPKKMDNAIDFLIGQTYKTKTGLVYLSECEIVSYEIDFAITRLLDLHLRATNQVPIIDTESHFSQKNAKDLFSISVSTMNSSILSFTDYQIEYFLNKLFDTCYKAKSIKGFESIFFTALSAYSGDNDFFKDYYYQKFISFGEITEFGGGFNNSYFIDKRYGAYIGFDGNINDIINESKFQKDSYTNFSNRIKNSKGITIDSTTGIAINSATMLTNLLGAAVVAVVVIGGITAINCHTGYESAQKVKKLDQDYKEALGQDPDNKGSEDDKKDSEDEFPKPPEKTDNPETCIINPKYEELRNDPYKNYSKGTTKGILPIGKGFRVYNFRTENNIYTVSNMPKIELSKNGLASINKLGLLNDFPGFKFELESRHLEYLKTLQPIQNKPVNKAGLFSDLKIFPTIDEIKESDPGYGINTQTYTHTTTDEAGNETVTTEEVNTIVFTNPALIARYGNSISMPSDNIENIIKFLKALSKSNNIGAIDPPKNAGNFKLNKFIQ